MCYPTREKGFCRCDYIQDLEMGKLTWIIGLGGGIECNYRGPYKAEKGGRRIKERCDDTEAEV